MVKTQTHEQFIHSVAALATARLGPDDAAKLDGIKLVYGSGLEGTRGVTFFHRWKGSSEPRPFVEISAFGQESWLQVAGTTLHELGHVIAGWQAGHGPEWKAACERLGLRRIKAAGTCYCRSMFEPKLREAIACLPVPRDGEPVPGLSGANPGAPVGSAPTLKPCGAGTGTRGGTSRGKGSGSRLRLWQCACAKPVKVRVASDHFRAHCDDCGAAFRQPAD